VLRIMSFLDFIGTMSAFVWLYRSLLSEFGYGKSEISYCFSKLSCIFVSYFYFKIQKTLFIQFKNMNLDKLIAITGMSGIYRAVVSRKNGMIVEDLDLRQQRFVPLRGYQFSPLQTIGIYTDDNATLGLQEVFQKMLDTFETNPPVAADAASKELFAYFGDILPNYDRDRVKQSDVRKIIKWFTFLKQRGVLDAAPAEAETEEKVAEA
jgi:Domain of unknown function (DUF5606)